MTTPKSAAAAPAKRFSLASIVAVDTSDLDVKDPLTGLSVGWTITFAGNTHPVTIALRNKMTKESADELRRQQQTRINGKKVHIPEADIEKNKRETAEYYAARIVKWSELDLVEGQDYPFTFDNAVSLFLNPTYNWAYAQVIEFLGEDSSFLKSSATT